MSGRKMLSEGPVTTEENEMPNWGLHEYSKTVITFHSLPLEQLTAGKVKRLVITYVL